jgi:hypothetical protein
VKPWRRKIGWLALLSVVLYGLLPSLAAFAARPAPAACVVVAKDHVCSCRPDPHALGDCCCGDHGSGSQCSLGKLPCDAGPAADGSLSALSHPLAPIPNATPGLPRFRAQRVVIPASSALRVVARDLLAPPPRLA